MLLSEISRKELEVYNRISVSKYPGFDGNSYSIINNLSETATIFVYRVLKKIVVSGEEADIVETVVIVAISKPSKSDAYRSLIGMTQRLFEVS